MMKEKTRKEKKKRRAQIPNSCRSACDNPCINPPTCWILPRGVKGQGGQAATPYYPPGDFSGNARARTLSSGSDDSGTSVDPLDSDYDFVNKVSF